MKEVLAVVDTDSIIYRAAYKFDPKEDDNDISFLHDMAIEWTNEFCNDILEKVNADKYVFCLAGDNNLRKTLFPDYKAGRPPRPFFYHIIRNYIINHYHHFLSHGAEAEDAVYSYWHKYKDEYEVVVCGIDKDLKQFPCTFYNYNRYTLEEVSEQDALYNKWAFLIMGDATDNIHTCKGYGVKKTQKLFKGCKIEEEFEFVALSLYTEIYGTLDGKSQMLWTKMLTQLHLINVQPIKTLNNDNF
jgi:5'-3' exonuclease